MTTTTQTTFPIASVRAEFPALAIEDGFLFFDNAAGAQLPRTVIDAVTDHMLHRQVQRGAPYKRSRDVDEGVARARGSVATFINASEPSEIAFGMNATSLIRLVSLAVGQTLADRREIIVTDLDHHANIATWLALEAAGAEIKWWRVRTDDPGLGPTLHAEDLEPLLSRRTRLVACPLASHALGTRVDVAAAAERVHAAGAELFVDAVHYLPHGPVDVQTLQMDYLVVSAYKMFAPHCGFLWGRLDALKRLPTFREEFIPDEPPHKIEAGTFAYENIDGLDAAIGYLEQIGTRVDPDAAALTRRQRLERAMEAIRIYEQTLAHKLLDVVESEGVTVHGVRDRARLPRRVPTFCFNVGQRDPAMVSERMAAAGVGLRDGNMYAPRLMERLGVPTANRLSLVHYNSLEEIDRFGEVLREIARS